MPGKEGVVPNTLLYVMARTLADKAKVRVQGVLLYHTHLFYIWGNSKTSKSLSIEDLVYAVPILLPLW